MFSLLNPDYFANGHPHAVYDQIRSSDPIWLDKGAPENAPVWLLTRQEDIRVLSRDNAHFTSALGFRIPTAARASMAPEIGQVLRRFMLSMDDPEHFAFRNLVGSNFMPARISNLKANVQERAEALMESLREKCDLDFVSDIGAKVPIQTVCSIMGVPVEDEWRVFEFTNAVFGTDDPEYAPSLEAANERYLAIFDYGWSLLEARRKEPRDDLVSQIANARKEDGSPLTRDEQVSYFSNLIAAGNETTRSSLSGAIWALSLFRDQRKALIDDPSLLPLAVQEILRWVSPVYHMSRTATQDVEIGGKVIAKGDRVAMLYGAGNHDPEVFTDPHTLNIRRDNSKAHVTFGYGIHHCLGFRLGTMQIEVLLEALLRRFPNYEVVTEPEYIRSNFVSAIKRLPIQLRV